MDYKEFSRRFDVLYNNISSNQAPSLNGYEKSVFLTKAQEEIVKTYFFSSGEGLKGFDGNQKRQIDFSFLLDECEGQYDSDLSEGIHDPRAFTFKLPDVRILFIVNESLVFRSNNNLQAIKQVVPISWDEYQRLMQRPYKEPLKNQAWRLLVKGTEDTNDNVVHRADIIIRTSDIEEYSNSTRSDLVSKVDYCLRYVRRPKPIIVQNLSEYGVDSQRNPILKIDGESTARGCELDVSVHEEILQRAVELARAAWGS